MEIDDYVMKRREYIAEIRRSFDTKERIMEDTVSESDNSSSILFFKLRFFLALCIFAAFILCKYTGYTFYTYDAKEVVDIITDNQYYTKLQNYVMIEGQLFGEKEAAQTLRTDEPEEALEKAVDSALKRKD